VRTGKFVSIELASRMDNLVHYVTAQRLWQQLDKSLFAVTQSL